LLDSSTRFRFCHIDVDVYESAKGILSWIWPRMVTGGIVVYDDYGFRECEGIALHVNEQLHEIDRLIFHNLNGHAILVKL
jgi:O-methyltransferase